MPRKVVIAAAVAFVMKLTLAWNTYGTNDVIAWDRFHQKEAADGALALYRDGIGIQAFPFIPPPFTLRIASMWAGLTEATGLPFPFWLRTTGAIADVGTLVLLWRLGRPVAGLMLVALYPVALLITGFHGNTDPILAFFLVLSVWAAQRYGVGVATGVALGMAMNTKIVAVLFIPVIAFSAPSIRRQFTFVASVGLTFVAGCLPWIAQDPQLVLGSLVNYSSQFGAWGILRVLTLPEPWFPPIRFFSLSYYVLGRYILLGTIVVFAWKARRSKLPLFDRAAGIIPLFLVLTFGFCVQYLAWMVPWTTAFRLRQAIASQLTGGAFLIGVYTFWSDGVPWFYASGITKGLWSPAVIPFELAAWAVIVWMVRDYSRRLNTLETPE